MHPEKLVALIEENADELTARMVQMVRESPRMPAYQRFGDEELGERARMVYANLGKWLGETSDAAVEEEYFQLGRVRSWEGIPSSELIWGLLLTRRNLWHFIEAQGWDTVLDLSEQLDLEILVVRFFDRAILHAVRGYEFGARGDRHTTGPPNPPYPGS